MARQVPSALLRRARARMLRAAAVFDQAERELREARRLLMAHPDYGRGRRARAGASYPFQHYTLPYWIERGIHATVNTANDAGGGRIRWGKIQRLLRMDAKTGGAEAELSKAQALERDDMKRLARRAKRAA